MYACLHMHVCTCDKHRIFPHGPLHILRVHASESIHSKVCDLEPVLTREVLAAFEHHYVLNLIVYMT